MPATVHSRPPLFDGRDRHLDDLAFLHFVPIADVDRGGGERELVESLLGVEPHDDQVELGADFRRRLAELRERRRRPGCGPPRSKNTSSSRRLTTRPVTRVSGASSVVAARGRRAFDQLVDRAAGERGVQFLLQLGRQLRADVRRRVVLALLVRRAADRRRRTRRHRLGLRRRRGVAPPRCEPI